MIEALVVLVLVVVGVSDGDTLTVQDGSVKTVLVKYAALQRMQVGGVVDRAVEAYLDSVESK